MVYPLTAIASRCLICHQPAMLRALTCGPDCAQAWRVLEYFRAHEGAASPPGPISLALVRLARGDAALVR